MSQYWRKLWPVAILAVLWLGYFLPLWKDRLVPFPGNLLVSFFSPWKEERWEGYPTGVPRKDLLGFDTVRMMGPWRRFVTQELRQGRLPVWNPHQFAGAPMLANGQSAVWFPLSWLYIFLPFEITWTILIVLQPLIAIAGMYLLLRRMFKYQSSHLLLFPALAYGFSAWMSVWIQWNIHGFVYALLPFALLGVYRKTQAVTILAMTAMIFAGHPQIALIAFTAIATFAVVYRRLKQFLFCAAVVLAITSVQWAPTLIYYRQASRETASTEFMYEKTLLPWKQLPQLLAPNFFGNPATGNFSGSANFVETTAYSGIAILVFALIAAINKVPKSNQLTIRYSWCLLSLILILVLPNPISLFIGKLGIPILSTSVASRWLMLWPLVMSLLAATGIDLVRQRRGWAPGALPVIALAALWVWALSGSDPVRLVARRNLFLPSSILVAAIGGMLLSLAPKLRKFATKSFPPFVVILSFLTLAELFLFAYKTMTYTQKRFIYPQTAVMLKLQELSRDLSRFAGSDGSVIETNFATHYGLFDLAGYDALYPRRIGELVWAAQNDGQPVENFSRSTVVMPTRPSLARDNLWNLAGVRWVVHKDDLLAQHPGQNAALFPPDKYRLTWESGAWQIYENLAVFPRAFFISDKRWVGEGEQIILNSLNSLNSLNFPTAAEIVSYLPAEVNIRVNAPTDGWLVLTDTYYPGWRASVDGESVDITPAFHAFRAISIPAGEHTVKFTYRSL